MTRGNRADDNAIDWYEAHAASVAERYEALSFPEVHNWLLYRLPQRRDTTVLDIGAGTGRDAAWLAERGHEVVAVEPSEALRREGQHGHPHPRIRWLNDRLPDDGTGALPLLRHIILNDDKSSTYKLALLRCLCRIADSADGLARYDADDTVDLPFGLVALTWIRAFQPLIARRLPQMPRHEGTTRGLGFAGEGFQRLLDLHITAADLHIGMRFTGERAAALSMALKECTANITRMPAHYTTYPNGGPVFCAEPARTRAKLHDVNIDEPYLWSFGSFRIPLDVWHALERFSVWIEPSLETEWKRLMTMYLRRQNRPVERSFMEQALAWYEPQRDVRLARERVAALRERGDPVYCVWSGKKLSGARFNIDHCFPWAVWPCEDLWNLLPTTRTVNNQKSARIPDARTLQEAGDRIQEWWQRAWLSNETTQLPERFRREAAATLAGLAEPRSLDLDDVFSAVTLRRMRLQHDQQVPEWQWSNPRARD